MTTILPMHDDEEDPLSAARGITLALAICIPIEALVVAILTYWWLS